MIDTSGCPDLSCRRCHPPEVACARCNAIIPRSTGTSNLDGGLRLTVGGWYGGTVDPIRAMTYSGNDPEAYLCDACARRFLTDNSWLANVDRDLTAPR